VVSAQSLHPRIRQFHDAFLRVSSERLDAKHPLGQFARVRSYLALGRCYVALQNEYAGGDSVLAADMEKEGFTRTRGTGVATVILKYLSNRLCITKDELQRIIHTGRGVQTLADEFGNGIVLLVSIHMMHK